MKNFFIIVLLCCYGCLNAPHSNIYDPDNPDKATVKGCVIEPDNAGYNGAIVELLQNKEIIYADTSDTDGLFEIKNIDPGIYEINVHTLHYAPQEFASESLWAGIIINNFVIEPSKLHFDQDTEGISAPYSFMPVTGQWSIAHDEAQAGMHSTPHVYKGSTSSIGDDALTLYRSSIDGDHRIWTMLKILESSGSHWHAGLVFQYQDQNNYYLLNICADSIVLSKIINGTETHLASYDYPFYTDTWYMLGIENYFTFMNVRVDTNILFSQIDNAFTYGKVGMWVKKAEVSETNSVSFDDVIIQHIENP